MMPRQRAQGRRVMVLAIVIGVTLAPAPIAPPARAQGYGSSRKALGPSQPSGRAGRSQERYGLPPGSEAALDRPGRVDRPACCDLHRIRNEFISDKVRNRRQ
jgi:hypothetical protein